MNAEWFQQQLALKRLSQRLLARYLGLDPSAITLMFKGKRRMQLDEAARIAEFIGAPIEDVLSNAGLVLEGIRSKRINIVGHIEHNNRLVEDEVSTQDTFIVPSNIPEGTVGIRVLNTLSPLHRAVLYFRKENIVDAGSIGRLSIVTLPNGEAYLAYVDRGTEPGLYNLKFIGIEGCDKSVPSGGRPFPLDDVLLKNASPILWIKP